MSLSGVAWHPAADGRSGSLRRRSGYVFPPARRPIQLDTTTVQKAPRAELAAAPSTAVRGSISDPELSDTGIARQQELRRRELGARGGRERLCGDLSERTGRLRPVASERARGPRAVIAWGSAGFARRAPSREGLGTLPGFPSRPTRVRTRMRSAPRRRAAPPMACVRRKRVPGASPAEAERRFLQCHARRSRCYGLSQRPERAERAIASRTRMFATASSMGMGAGPPDLMASQKRSHWTPH